MYMSLMDSSEAVKYIMCGKEGRRKYVQAGNEGRGAGEGREGRESFQKERKAI
jgi:hypothetical protein